MRKAFFRLLIMTLLFMGTLACTVNADITDMRFTDGQIKIIFRDKAASTGTVYRTVGWIIHKTSAAGRDAYITDTPVGIMIGDDMEESKREDHSDGTVSTTFQIDTDTVTWALAAADMGGIKDGDTVYLDSVFQVYRNGAPVSGECYTYEQIKNGAPWGSQTIEDLKSYYNIAITYASANHPVYKEIRLNGKTVSKEKIGEGKTGKGYNVKLDKTVDFGGKKADISKSYIYREVAVNEKLFELNAADPKVTDRTPEIYAGGITVVGEYSVSPTVRVEHYDLDAKKLLETEPEFTVAPGSTVTKSAKSFDGKSYFYSETSEDSGVSWKQRSDKPTRNIIVNTDTVIRFYYSANTGLLAQLTLTADPAAIEEGKTASVKFTLDASNSKADDGIKEYKYWFRGEDETEFPAKPSKVTTDSVITIEKSGVEPGSKWYAKVEITDKKGKKSEAEADVRIEVIKAKPKAEIKPNLKLNIVYNTDMIDNWTGDYHTGWGRYDGYDLPDGTKVFVTGGGPYYVDVYVPDDYLLEDKDVYLTFTLDASKSESTNGIGSYQFDKPTANEHIQSGGSPVTSPFQIKLLHKPSDVINGSFSNKYEDTGYLFSCIMSDSQVTSERAYIDVMLQYRYIFGKVPPEVTLDINRTEFAIGETAYFTPGFKENDHTYSIETRDWAILTEAGEVIEEGAGEIPPSYRLALSKGKYKARQYITYRDRAGNDNTLYAEVSFTVYSMRPPDVKISSDKDVYIIPTTGIFTVEYIADPKYSYQIVDKSWKFMNSAGGILSEGSGQFPHEYDFILDYPTGYYTAEQTIYYWEAGVYTSRSADCTVKLISPVPQADFSVSMQMSYAGDDWQRIDTPGRSGKVNKQIRIDLSPSDALNAAIECPYPVDYSSADTQIKIIPLADDGVTQALDKNRKIFVYNRNDKKTEDNIVTFKAKRSIDVRFDLSGSYIVKCRVSNGSYISPWIERKIYIRDDLPPLVSLSFADTTDVNGRRTVYRDTNDLHVRYGVKIKAVPQDEDTIDYDSARLNISYDYNADGNTANDGIPSIMYVTKAHDELQKYIYVGKNSSMDSFSIDMISDSFPVLGLMSFEYSVCDRPAIPNYTGGDLPAPPKLPGDTSAQTPESKTVLADNREGVITLDTAKKGAVDIVIMQGGDSLSTNASELKNYYGNDANVIIVRKDGSREIIN